MLRKECIGFLKVSETDDEKQKRKLEAPQCYLTEAPADVYTEKDF